MEAVKFNGEAPAGPPSEGLSEGPP